MAFRRKLATLFLVHGRADLTLQGNQPANKQTAIPIVFLPLARMAHSAVDLGLVVWDYQGQGTNRSGCRGTRVHDPVCLAEKGADIAGTHRDKNKEGKALFLMVPCRYNRICNNL